MLRQPSIQWACERTFSVGSTLTVETEDVFDAEGQARALRMKLICEINKFRRNIWFHSSAMWIIYIYCLWCNAHVFTTLRLSSVVIKLPSMLAKCFLSRKFAEAISY